MLRSLTSEGIGPARRFDMTFGPRLNLVTGDNGLGKSFLLDLAWWVCARDWPDQPALPSLPMGPEELPEPALAAVLDGLSKQGAPASYRFVPEHRDWKRAGRGRPTIPGIVLYMRIDGGFSVWDPARHYYKRNVAYGIDDKDRAPAFHLTKEEAWRGARDDAGTTVSRGLLIDWQDWQKSDGDDYAVFKAVLERLSPPGEQIRIHSEQVRLPGGGVDRVPALAMPYGLVPVTLASAGLKRILALAYLIVWMWLEHRAACQANRMPLQRQLIVIADELEAHLHPHWQRSILPALLAVGGILPERPDVQFVISTHSPLVLASAEPEFDPDSDKLFHLRHENRQAVLEDTPWHLRGDVGNWLVSDIFALDAPRSIPAARLLGEARALMRAETPEPAAISDLEQRLATVLPGTDPFWGQWHRFTTRIGGAPS